VSRIDVRGMHDGTFIFTVTEHDQAPWGTSNTTIFIPPEHLQDIIAKLHTRLVEIQQMRQAQPALAIGQRVAIRGNFRQDQVGTVVEAQEKSARVQQQSGQRWSYTVAFPDGNTWRYTEDELSTE
jgi:hypothetical protein